MGGRVRRVKLPRIVGRDIACLLIGCAYGEQQLSINQWNLEEFYEICTRYQIHHGISVCLNFAKKMLNIDNCVYMLQLAAKHGHRKLGHAAYSFVRSNFKQVLAVNQDFHWLDLGRLRGLLMDDSLKLDEDEEIVWLAILRWIDREPMTHATMTNLYNQMVAGPQDVEVNLFQSNALREGPINQQANRRHSLVNRMQPTRIRVQVNFNSSEHAIVNGSCMQSAENGGSSVALSSLRQLTGLNGAGSRVDELSLCSLIKCLRFMRFKSANAFDVISSHPLVSKSTKLTELLNHMRVRYKLRHKIALSEDDKRSMSQEQLARLEHELSKVQRTLKRITEVVGMKSGDSQQRRRPLGGPANSAGPIRAAAERGNRTEDPLALLQLDASSLDRAAKPRVPSSVGLLFGGFQDGTISKRIWAYDFIYDRWFKLNIKLPEARAFHASCASPATGHVYIFGGTDGKQILSTVWRFNPASDVRTVGRRQRRSPNGQRQATEVRVTKRSKLYTRTIGSGAGAATTMARPRPELSYKFKQLCPMNEQRCLLAGVFHSDGRLYALGGHNGSQRLRSAEWYDPNSNQWHQIAEMTIARSDAAACSHENRIFIAGGQISNQFIQSSVEFYKSSDDTWTFAAPMIIPRMSFCLASFKNNLIALGGTNGLTGGDEVASVTRSVERYNHETRSWTFCVPMGQARCSFDTMLIGDKLIVAGGHSGSRRLKTCETLRIVRFSETLDEGPEQGPAPRDPANHGRTGSHMRQARQAPPEATGQRQGPSSGLAGSHLRSRSLPELMPNQRSQNQNGPGQISIGVVSSDAWRSRPFTLASAMRWFKRADLPERRSGFSIAVINQLRNAKEYTYFGSAESPRHQNENGRLRPKACLVRAPSRWNKFKLMKRRKLIKHVKIALVVTIVILMM